MVWTKLDDGIADHPKIATVGIFGFAWFTASIVWSNRNETDGFIPWARARELLPMQWVDLEDRVWHAGLVCGHVGRDGQEAVDFIIDSLVAVGLWQEIPGGYLVHDFLDWNPSKAELEDQRRQKRAAGQAGGRASARARAQAEIDDPPSTRSTDSTAESNPVPVPVPVPVKAQSKGADAPSGKPVENGALSSDQSYLLDQLRSRGEDWWSVTAGAIRLLNEAHGRPVVTQALQRAHEETELVIRSSAFALLSSMCEDIEGAA